MNRRSFDFGRKQPSLKMTWERNRFSLLSVAALFSPWEREVVLNCREEAGFAHAEAALLELLSEGFSRPTTAFVSRIVAGRYRDDFATVLNADGEDTKQFFAALDKQRENLSSCDPEKARLILEVDYNRLFVGPGSLLAPPYESFYGSQQDGGRGRLRTQAERDVAQAYKRHGWTISEESGELADHIAAELLFLSKLSHQEALAWEREDADAALELHNAANDFRQTHILTWLSHFVDLVQSGSRTELYPALGQLACGVIV